MTVKQRLSRSNIYMFLIPLLIAAALLLVGAGIALYVLETVYLPKIGLSLQEMHITLEQYESMFAKFEVFLWGGPRCGRYGAAADDGVHECVSHALALPAHFRAAGAAGRRRGACGARRSGHADRLHRRG